MQLWEHLILLFRVQVERLRTFALQGDTVKCSIQTLAEESSHSPSQPETNGSEI